MKLVVVLASWIIVDAVAGFSFLGLEFGEENAREPRGVVKKSNE
jgi:hypothetical protein